MPRFIADVMLGSLARWLRILGFDTLYFRSIGDNELIKMGPATGQNHFNKGHGYRTPEPKKNESGSRGTGEKSVLKLFSYTPILLLNS